MIQQYISTYNGNPKNNIPSLDEVDDGKKVSNFQAHYFSSSASRSTEVSTIFGLTLNTASLSAPTFVDPAIGSQHAAEKEVAKEGGRYNMNYRGKCNRRLNNGGM